MEKIGPFCVIFSLFAHKFILQLWLSLFLRWPIFFARFCTELRLAFFWTQSGFHSFSLFSPGNYTILGMDWRVRQKLSRIVWSAKWTSIQNMERGRGKQKSYVYPCYQSIISEIFQEQLGERDWKFSFSVGQRGGRAFWILYFKLSV